MWMNTIAKELINKFIVEMKKKENINDIQMNILDPIIKYAFSQMYPYILITSIIFFLTFMLAVAILFFVIRDHMKN
jgi:hypothetical protein